MPRQLWRWIALLLFVPTSLAHAEDARWMEVEQHLERGRPRSALVAIRPILNHALQQKSYAEASRALATRIVVEAMIEGGDPRLRVELLEAALPETPDEMHPVLHAVAARWMWHYFTRNRYRISARTRGGVSAGASADTWDLGRILQEVEHYFQRALDDKRALQRIPIHEWQDLLEGDRELDAVRPTLYDFIVHEAIDFYAAGEHGAIVPEDAFRVTADDPLFAPREEFLRWEPQAAEGWQPIVSGLRQYQELLAFHQDDADSTALLEADLDRLQFAFNVAGGTWKHDRYKEALAAFAERSRNHPATARAWALLATQRKAAGDLSPAHKLANRALSQFPGSHGATLAAALVQQIEAKALTLVTEQVWNAPLPPIKVQHRNVDAVHFRLYSYVSDTEALNRFGVNQSDRRRLEKLLDRKPYLEWSHNLTPTPDFETHIDSLTVPEGLEPGEYTLVASPDPGFELDNNLLSTCHVWVSDLALVIRDSNRGWLEGLVLWAESGEPVRDATIRYRHRGSLGGSGDGKVKSDRNGVFRIYGGKELYLIAEKGPQRLGSKRYLRVTPTEKLRIGTTFFTDRAIYRPGQTIYYKGIHHRSDPENDVYDVLAGRQIAVTFLDVNGKVIAQQQHHTNDYGSFSGVFTAPRDRLPGLMQIRDGRGRASFRVEEYKRPAFEVELDKPASAALGQRVTIEGHAETYSGVPVSHAEVRWKVQRQVFMRYWSFRYGRPHGAAQIAHGVARTDADGHFRIHFDADPGETDAASNPLFLFQVSADVIDGTGEVRSATSDVPLGYTSLQADVLVEEWQVTTDSVLVNVRTTTPGGTPVGAPGRVRVYELQQPPRVTRPEQITNAPRADHSRWRSIEPALAGPRTWETGAQVASDSFTTDDAGSFRYAARLEAGIYRVVVALQDAFGKPVEVQREFHVLNPNARRFDVHVPHLLQARSMTVEPGEEFEAIWGTGYPEGRAWVQLEHRGEVLQAYWTPRNRTQHRIRQKIEEDMRGGLILRIVYVRENRAYIEERIIEVPWSIKKLTLTWERFRSRLEPDRPETWIARIRDHENAAAVVEAVATLYDASLDAIHPHEWTQRFESMRRERIQTRFEFMNRTARLWPVVRNWPRPSRAEARDFPAFPSELIVGRAALFVRGGRSLAVQSGLPSGNPAKVDMNLPPSMGEVATTAALPTSQTATRDIESVQARRDLRETAFFFPELRSDPDGNLRLEFRMPETLTNWRFMVFAHDAELRSGSLEDRAYTSKDFMVEPNPPRFVREGDMIELTAKLSNRSQQRLRGRVRLTMRDARTGDAVDAAVENLEPELAFDLRAAASSTVAWRLHIPDAMGFLTYRVVGVADSLSDGEEGYLPVLSRRILVSESLPLPLRGKQTRAFSFDKLRKSGRSKSLRHQSLTLQMTSQPAWYAVLALPYLMDSPYDCSDSIFYRLYANSLAFHIAHSDPKIRRVFDQWRDTPALDSPLEKNEELKAVMLEETPWVRQAMSESRARRNVGILFDVNRLTQETGRLLVRLQQLQSPSGLWPWFAGGKLSEAMTLRMVSGFGRLRHMGVEIDVTQAKKALNALDKWMFEKYRRHEEERLLGDNNLGPVVALYLYGRSFFLEDVPIETTHQDAIEYWQKQARRHWPNLAGRQSQAHVALGLLGFGDRATAEEIVRSFEERSVHDEELGMHWRDTEQFWWWYRAPIETQAMMIEAFREITGNDDAVEACQVWLLKQKQTQDWKTTRATADAVYALLLGGKDLLASDALVEVRLGGQEIEPQDVEAGTGYYEQRFVRGEVQPQMGDIELVKRDDGVSWGSVHWQYLEDISKITPSRDNPLRIEKRLFTKVTTAKGPELRAVKGPVQVGDELVVRLVLRTDRDLEYVHLKDHRGSGTEPALSVSRYRWQDGLGYYETMRDTAAHFFIDYLRRGTYVFEYSTRVQLRGEYQSGIALVQCLYAPEFQSHSESFGLTVE